jgi:hypothetical protein
MLTEAVEEPAERLGIERCDEGRCLDRGCSYEVVVEERLISSARGVEANEVVDRSGRLVDGAAVDLNASVRRGKVLQDERERESIVARRANQQPGTRMRSVGASRR